MRDDVFDENLKGLLRAAPERARLSPEARRRIRAELSSVWAGPASSPAPQKTVAPPPPRLRLLPSLAPKLVAAAAAALVIALGVSRLIGDPAGGVLPAEGPGLAAGVDSSTPSPRNPELDTVAGELAATGSTDPQAGPGLASPVQPGERVPGLGARGEGGDTNREPSDPGVPKGEVAAAASTVLATVEMAAPTSIDALPPTLTLWVKAVVQLPQVADPVPFEVPLAFADVDADGRVFADLQLQGGLAHVHAMGAENVLLQVELAGMAPSRALVSTEDAAAGSVRFALEPGISFSGTVVDEADGTPIQGALVVALDQLPLDALAVGTNQRIERLPQPYTVTDALGRYTLAHVARRDIVRLRASSDEYAPTIAPVVASSPDGTSIALGRGTTVTGIVERSDGTRWENAVVVVSLSGRDPSALDRPAMSYGIDQCDSNGEFSVSGLPAGNYVALVFSPTDRENPVEFRQVRIKGSPLLRVDFLSTGSDPIATDGLTLDGVLVDVDGQTLGAESLSISSMDGEVAPFSEWRVADTRADGRFRFPGIGASYYIIHRVLDGFERMTPVWEGRVDASQTLRIELEDTHAHLTWRGASEDGRSWTILERWRGEQEGFDYTGSAPTSKGTALRETQFDHLPSGRYRAVLMGPGHGATWSDAFEVESGRKAQTTTRLKPGAPFAIRLTDQDSGQIVEGAVFKVFDADGRRIPQREALTTDLEGLATQLSVPFERITLRVFGPGASTGAAPQITREIDFRERQQGPLEIELPPR